MEHLRLMEQGGQLDSCAADANVSTTSTTPIPSLMYSPPNRRPPYMSADAELSLRNGERFPLVY